MLTNWKARALAAEAAIARAQEMIDGLQLIQADRAALVSIVTQGRINRFTFVRNGVLTVVETYSTMDDDVPGWRKALLQ